MNRSHSLRFWPALVGLAAVVLACSTPLKLLGIEPTPTAALEATLPAALLTSAATEEVPTPSLTAPLPTLSATEAVPTATQPAAAPFQVATETIKEENNQPPSPYGIDLEYPRFSGAPEPAADDLNQQVNELVTRQRTEFDEMVKTPTPVEFQTGPHGLNMRYEVRYNDGKYVSIYFQISLYNSGAAHPLPYSETLTYDVGNQRVLQLGDLFQPGSDYLTVLSEKSIASLHSQDITGGEEGAAPVENNYRNWNLSPDGLLITFDPYQVAAYARGYVPILIPWAELGDILTLDI